MDTEDTTVDTMATLTDTVTTEARGLPNPKPMLMPKLPLMPGTDTTAWDTADTMAVTDTVWDTTDTDTVWDTVATTDTDIPVVTVMSTTTARGLLMPNLKPKPKLIPLLMLGTDTMAVDTDTGMA